MGKELKQEDSPRRDKKAHKAESKKSKKDHKKKDDRKHKHRSGNKHSKKDNDRKDSRDDSQHHPKLPTTSLELKYKGHISHISMDDYFTKSCEFRVWLKLVQQKNFEDMTSKEAHKMFEKEFVPSFNFGALDAMYYTGDIPLELRRGATNTQHKWQFTLSSTDHEKLADLVEDVDMQTRKC